MCDTRQGLICVHNNAHRSLQGATFWSVIAPSQSPHSWPLSHHMSMPHILNHQFLVPAVVSLLQMLLMPLCEGQESLLNVIWLKSRLATYQEMLQIIGCSAKMISNALKCLKNRGRQPRQIYWSAARQVLATRDSSDPLSICEGEAGEQHGPGIDCTWMMGWSQACSGSSEHQEWTRFSPSPSASHSVA